MAYNYPTALICNVSYIPGYSTSVEGSDSGSDVNLHSAQTVDGRGRGRDPGPGERKRDGARHARAVGGQPAQPVRAPVGAPEGVAARRRPRRRTHAPRRRRRRIHAPRPTQVNRTLLHSLDNFFRRPLLPWLLTL